MAIDPHKQATKEGSLCLMEFIVCCFVSKEKRIKQCCVLSNNEHCLDFFITEMVIPVKGIGIPGAIWAVVP